MFSSPTSNGLAVQWERSSQHDVGFEPCNHDLFVVSSQGSGVARVWCHIHCSVVGCRLGMVYFAPHLYHAHRTSRKKTPWTAHSVCGSGVTWVWYHINFYSMVQVWLHFKVLG